LLYLPDASSDHTNSKNVAMSKLDDLQHLQHLSMRYFHWCVAGASAIVTCTSVYVSCSFCYVHISIPRLQRETIHSINILLELDFYNCRMQLIKPKLDGEFWIVSHKNSWNELMPHLLIDGHTAKWSCKIREVESVTWLGAVWYRRCVLDCHTRWQQ
jgi:hypothetical protein